MMSSESEKIDVAVSWGSSGGNKSSMGREFFSGFSQGCSKIAAASGRSSRSTTKICRHSRNLSLQKDSGHRVLY
jgi:hypothetical protein